MDASLSRGKDVKSGGVERSSIDWGVVVAEPKPKAKRLSRAV